MVLEEDDGLMNLSLSRIESTISMRESSLIV